MTKGMLSVGEREDAGDHTAEEAEVKRRSRCPFQDPVGPARPRHSLEAGHLLKVRRLIDSCSSLQDTWSQGVIERPSSPVRSHLKATMRTTESCKVASLIPLARKNAHWQRLLKNPSLWPDEYAADLDGQATFSVSSESTAWRR